jgi:serine O-acetyltransferase
MNMSHKEQWVESLVPEIITGLAKCWQCPFGLNTSSGWNLSGQQAIHKMTDDVITVLFPGCLGHAPVEESDLHRYLDTRLSALAVDLKAHIVPALQYQCAVEHGKKCDQCGDCNRTAESTVAHLFRETPRLRRILDMDIQAAYDGDPAARSMMEVVMSYPGLFAIVVHRVAHVLYRANIPLIPRIMSEYAHSRTGIDIHPGAKIGPGFFIDHGTGVVIGETCEIGKNVKLYQGVTLGALSFEKDAEGRLVKGTKRHPNVEDNVVIYAGATILGGKTTIGANSVIGGNVWLTRSVPPETKVYNQQPKPLIRQGGDAAKSGDA